MPTDSKFALMMPQMGIGDQICLIPSLKKLREKYGKFDILYFLPHHEFDNIKPKLPFYDESEYIKNYTHVHDNQNSLKEKDDIILYDEIGSIFDLSNREMFSKALHTSNLFLKYLNLEYNDETPEKEIEINVPKNCVNEYAYFKDYYVIAPCHNQFPYGRWFNLNVYSKLIKQFNKNIKFVTLYDLPLPYETETFWPDSVEQLQFFLKSVRGVVTIDSSIQHYCNALRKKALVLWGYGKSRIKKHGYKSHINIFNEEYNFYDDLHYNSYKFTSGRTRKDIDYEIFFEAFEKLIEETR